jgi:hypothetical protein
LYLPYVGDGYKWNWKTLAKLDAKLLQRYVNFPTLLDCPRSSILPYSPYVYLYSAFNIPFVDDLSVRLDPVYNFKKGLVDPETTDRGAQYICPTDGRYKINVFSSIEVNMTGDPTNIQLIGQSPPSSDYG